METRSLILLIEDDPDVAQSLREGLQRNGYDAVWKSSGAEGLSYAKASNPHLIILDVRLPDGSGFDFCRQMREARLRQPILMLTVHGEESDKVLGLEVGADDYLTKPYSLSELLARVHRELSPGPTVAHPPHRLTQEVGGATGGVGPALAQPGHQHLAGAGGNGQQRVIAAGAGIAVVARSLLGQSIGLADGRVQVDGQGRGLAAPLVR